MFNYNTIFLLDKQRSYCKYCNKTLLKMGRYFFNSFDYDLSNVIVEGINNLIKQINHMHVDIKHFKCRIMIIKGLYNKIQT